MNYAPRDARNSNIALERENRHFATFRWKKEEDVICMPLCYIECNVRWLLDCIYFQ